MINFFHFSGIITTINDQAINVNEEPGCHKLITVENENSEVVNFVVSAKTYFVNYERVFVGDRVTGYYDGSAPTILIYPPQYNALIMVKENINQNVKVDYFNDKLESNDGILKLNLSPYTQIILINNQFFTGNPANRNLIVIYGPVTKSIPAQTTPYKIIVWCNN